MNEIDFRAWLNNEGLSRKVQSDLVSRIKRVERACGNCDIDDEYRKDGCAFLLSVFRNKGINDNMGRFGEPNLPIGKYHLSTYKYAVQKYVIYRNMTSNNK